MRKDVLIVVSVVVFTVLVARCLAAQDNSNPPALLVAPFSGNKAEVPGWQTAVGQGIAAMLIESLGNANKKFQVLEASEANALQDEPKSAASNSAGSGSKSAKGGSAGPQKSATGDTASSEKPDAGGSTDSDFILSGSVAEFAAQTNSSKIGDFISSSPLADLGAKMVTAHVRIDWCLVDAVTKKVITRGTAAGSAHGSEFDMAALAAADAKTADVTNVASAATHVKTAKAASGGNSGANNLASVNNIFSGLNKAWGGSSGGAGAGDNAKGNNGTTVSSSKTSLKTSSDGSADEGETIGYDNSIFMNSALGKATAEAVTNIIEQLAAINLPESARVARLKTATDALKHTPGKVIAVAGKDTIIVSLGGKEGFQEGDKLELYQTTDVKDDKGNVVYTDEKSVGELTIVSVQDDRCRASYAGDLTVQQGWTVKAK